MYRLLRIIITLCVYKLASTRHAQHSKVPKVKAKAYDEMRHRGGPITGYCDQVDKQFIYFCHVCQAAALCVWVDVFIKENVM